MKRIASLVTLTAGALGLLDIIAVLTTATKVDAKVKLAVLGSRHLAQVLATKALAKCTLAVLGLTRRKTVLAWMKQRAVLLADVLKTTTIVLITAMVAVTAQLVMPLTAVVTVATIVAQELAQAARGTLVAQALTILIHVPELMPQATAQERMALRVAEPQVAAVLTTRQIAIMNPAVLGKPLLH
jgi:hypothetical protein